MSRIAIQGTKGVCDGCGNSRIVENWVPRTLSIPGWTLTREGNDCCSAKCYQVVKDRIIEKYLEGVEDARE